MKEIKAAVIGINGKMSSQWLVGDSMTVADVMVFAHLCLPFQLILDNGLKKPAAKVTNGLSVFLRTLQLNLPLEMLR